MAKRSSNEWDSGIDEEEIPQIPDTVLLVLLRDMNLTIVGKVTGKTYNFNGAGSIQDVDKKDAEIMLTKMSGKCDCPGSIGSSPYFEIAR